MWVTTHGVRNSVFPSEQTCLLFCAVHFRSTPKGSLLLEHIQTCFLLNSPEFCRLMNLLFCVSLQCRSAGMCMSFAHSSFWNADYGYGWIQLTFMCFLFASFSRFICKQGPALYMGFRPSAFWFSWPDGSRRSIWNVALIGVSALVSRPLEGGNPLQGLWGAKKNEPPELKSFAVSTSDTEQYDLQPDGQFLEVFWEIIYIYYLYTEQRLLFLLYMVLSFQQDILQKMDTQDTTSHISFQSCSRIDRLTRKVNNVAWSISAKWDLLSCYELDRFGRA